MRYTYQGRGRYTPASASSVRSLRPVYRDHQSDSLAPLVPDHKPVQASELSLNQKIALLSLSKDKAASLVYGRLKERSDIPKPMLSDYQALANFGLATRPHRFHDITARGATLAREIGKKLASHYGIHAFYRGGDDQYDFALCCTCGYSRPVSRSMSKRAIEIIKDRHIFGNKAVNDLLAAMSPAKSETAA